MVKKKNNLKPKNDSKKVYMLCLELQRAVYIEFFIKKEKEKENRDVRWRHNGGRRRKAADMRCPQRTSASYAPAQTTGTPVTSGGKSASCGCS